MGKVLAGVRIQKIHGQNDREHNQNIHTIHEFDQDLLPQNDLGNCSRKVQHSQKDSGYKHKALTHSQTSNQIPG